ncbi:MAG: MFS transporter [Candidatus Kapaibacterium sp.]|nr:MAG: MFS transporter [Candidatus Kapabacteria bacterium]
MQPSQASAPTAHRNGHAHVHDADFTKTYNIWSVIGASSAGTLIEWYDFYIFGSLATIIDTQFFPKDNPTAALLSTLAVFATGFIVRPFGAIVFGRLGDIVGRKFTFLLTLILMGGSTFAIGLLPGYEAIGIMAPLLLLLLRLLQGLALGGEYGGAATYIAEHCPDGKRGYYTSFIQTTATLGLFVSLGVILAVRTSIGEAAFKDWGWRIPFILSIILVVVSYFIRIKMKESPMFARLKASGKASVNPLKESFGNWYNLKFVLLALFGATAGQGVVWYTGQFYAFYYIQNLLKLDYATSVVLLSTALLIGTPFFVFFGWLSDRIGRKWIIMTGCAIAVVAYIPIYQTMITAAGFTPEYLKNSAPALQANITTLKTDLATAQASNNAASAKTLQENITKAEKALPDVQNGVFTPVVANGLAAVKTLPTPDKTLLVILITLQVFLVTMVYGPIAAFLVEMFPTKIRYTSMSLPYHIGNGVFGGLLPLIGTAAVAATNNPLAGLWYPIAVAGITFLIGASLLQDKHHSLWEELEVMREEGKAV